MTPDRLRGWLQRNMVGATTLQLRHDGMGEGTVFQRWPVRALGDDMHDLVTQICEASAFYADSVEETVRVAIEFLSDEDEVIASTIHKARPEKVTSEFAANAANVSEGTIISQLLHHIEVQQRVMSGSNVGAFQTLERALTLQNKLVERQAQQIQALADQVIALQRVVIDGAAAVQAAEGEDAVTTEEESRARARAFDKFAELLPMVADTAMAYARSRFNGHGGDVAGAAVGG